MATALLARILEGGTRRDVVWCAVLIGLALLSHPLQLVYLPILCAPVFGVGGLALFSSPGLRKRFRNRSPHWTISATG